MEASGPLLLAVDTATSVTAVALLRGEELLDQSLAPADLSTAEGLLPAIDELLGRARVDSSALEAFAVSIGPGSFTSLRIGIATVKGLAFGTANPVAPVSTLAALAFGSDPGDAVVALLDARRGEVYAAAWPAADVETTPLVAEGVYTPEELARRLPPRCRLVGEGAALIAAELQRRLGPGVRRVPGRDRAPCAHAVGILGARLLARGDGVDAAALLPRYVRRAEAEVKRTGQRFEPGA